MFKLLLLVVVAAATASKSRVPYMDQLMNYKAKTKVAPILTTSAGAPIDYDTATSSLNDEAIINEALMEMLMHFDRETIPPRVAHAQGTGAFGHFVVTDDVSEYCKADFLNGIGKKTPVAVRFSTTSPLAGGSEFVRENRGCAFKFYTQEGNYDLAGLDSEVFSVSDPIHTSNLVHVAKLSPATNFADPNMSWDFITQRPEVYRRLLHSMGPMGMPASYSHMSCHGIHTFELYNKHGTKYACKIDLWPCAGRKPMNQSDIDRLSTSEPQYFSKTLYNSIKNGDYPSWDVTLKCMNQEEVEKEGSDIYDITKLKAWNKYKAVKAGKITLTKTYDNYHRDVEQMAFCPGNKVPGMLGSPDKLAQARTFSYKDTQEYRLGVNFERLKVNCPLTKVNNYNRNGAGSNGDNGGEGPWYAFNTFNGPEPVKEENRPSLSVIHQKEADNLDDCQDYYSNTATEYDREVIIANFCNQLSEVYSHIRAKAIKYLYKINHNLGKRVEKCLKAKCVQ